jgi:hypothetical protein
MTNSDGFKRGTALSILGIKPETLRYWKKRLDPQPTRKVFSSGCLLAYWILKQLIQHRGSNPQHLANFDLHPLFSRCETTNVDEIEKSRLVLDHALECLHFESLSVRSERCDHLKEKIDLTLVVHEYTDRLLNFGRPSV